MKLHLLIFILLPLESFCQNATFSADTTGFSLSRIDILHRIMESEWKINGQTLEYGSKPVSIKTDDVVDTILFRQYVTSKWDTIICNIREAKSYVFLYNECCGGFNVADETGKFITASVTYALEKYDQDKTLIGTLGETGIIVSNIPQTLTPACRSAMSPNVFQLTLNEITICGEKDSCMITTCLSQNDKALIYEFGYNIISVKLDCLYLPLSNQPVKIVYNSVNETVKFE